MINLVQIAIQLLLPYSGADPGGGGGGVDRVASHPPPSPVLYAT